MNYSKVGTHTTFGNFMNMSSVENRMNISTCLKHLALPVVAKQCLVKLQAIFWTKNGFIMKQYCQNWQ